MKSVAIEHFHSSADRRLRVEWDLGKRCNFDCSYCSSYTHDNVSTWKSIDEYKGVVDKLMTCTDKEVWVSFTGGEPCIYPGFKDLVKYCKEQGMHSISVCSNGSSKPEFYVDLFNYINSIVISCHFEYKVSVIDSILAIKDRIKDLKNGYMHVHVMMLPGHFKESMKTINILKQNEVPFAIRRIRPLYNPDGSVTRPYQKGGDLKLTSSGPDYSDDEDYYSQKELDFFRGDVHEYI